METLLTYLLSPVVFFSVIAAVFIASCVVIFSLSRRTTLLLKDKDDLVAKMRVPLKDLEDKRIDQEIAYKERLLQLERALKGSEEKHFTATEQETKLKSDNAVLRKTIDELRAEIADKEARLSQLVVSRNDNDALKKTVENLKNINAAASMASSGESADASVVQKVIILQEQLAKMGQELSLKNELYDGLKAQYGEMEKSFEGVMQQLEKEKKSQQLLSQRLWEISKPR